MDLKDFVKETLVQIVDAVVEAQSHIRNKGALINPRMAEELRVADVGEGHGYRPEKKSLPDPQLVRRLGFYLTANNVKVDMVDFDVAVTASSTAEEKSTMEGGAKGGGSIRVASVEFGGKTESAEGITRTDERLSHVKFRIPIALPQQE